MRSCTKYGFIFASCNRNLHLFTKNTCWIKQRTCIFMSEIFWSQKYLWFLYSTTSADKAIKRKAIYFFYSIFWLERPAPFLFCKGGVLKIFIITPYSFVYFSCHYLILKIVPLLEQEKFTGNFGFSEVSDKHYFKSSQLSPVSVFNNFEVAISISPFYR